MKNKKENISEGEICKKCKAKCCKLGGTEFTKKEMQRVLKEGYPNYFIKINDNHYEAKTKKGVCSYLNKNHLCSIHNAKPKMCWAWPVFMDFEKNKKVFYLMQCPLTPKLREEEIKIMKKYISGYMPEFVECNETKMSDKEVKSVMNRFYKFKKKRIR